MFPTQRNAFVLLLATLAAGVGSVDALLSRHWDLAGVLLLVIALHGVVLFGLRADRPPVGLRPDLAGWVRQRAEAAGEPPGRVADRAVAAYRAGLLADPVNRPGDRS